MVEDAQEFGGMRRRGIRGRVRKVVTDVAGGNHETEKGRRLSQMRKRVIRGVQIKGRETVVHDNKEGQSKMIILVASETEEHVHLSRARGSNRVEVLLPGFQGWVRTEQAGREEEDGTTSY